MKKREITNNELEQLFNKVIGQTPLMNEEQVNSLLNSLPKATKGNATKPFFHNYLNTLIIGTIVLSIVLGAILWVNTAHKTEKIIVQNNQPQENKVAPAPADTIVARSAGNIGKEMFQDTTHEVNTLKTSSLKTSSVPIQTDTITSLSDIYEHFDKCSQIFSIQADRDTTIICKEGTMIKIKANSFVSGKTGDEILGKVQIRVKEYYKLSDMLLSNLSTTSGNEVLETGGMLHITASVDNENCIIKQGHEIEIGFPYSNKKVDMALFNGELTNEKIDWKLSKTASIDEIIATEITISVAETASDLPYQFVEQMPEFPGDETALKKYTGQNAQYPFSALKDKIEGAVYVNFLVDKSGAVDNIRIARGLDNTLDKVAVHLVSNMPKWIPGRQNGEAVTVSYTLPVKFALKDSPLTDEEIRQSKVLEERIKNVRVYYQTTNYQTNNKGFKEEFEKKVKNDDFQKTSASDVNRYVFSVSLLGWINCDRFDSYNRPKTNYSILIDQPDKTIVNIVFHRFKAIVTGCAASNRINFKNVPLGEKITIVALKTVNNKIFLAVKETAITEKEETVLDFKPVTLDLLKEEMERLNKVN
jgi:TonB family protein